jgi:hypothetical protein
MILQVLMIVLLLVQIVYFRCFTEFPHFRMMNNSCLRNYRQWKKVFVYFQYFLCISYKTTIFHLSDFLFEDGVGSGRDFHEK